MHFRVVLECAKMGKMQQCCGACQDGQNATMLWNVPKWEKCNNVLKECAKMGQMCLRNLPGWAKCNNVLKECAKMGQMCLRNLPGWAKCNNVLKECAKMGQMKQCFKEKCQDGPSATMF